MLRPACPNSGTVGRPVPLETLASLLHPQRLAGADGHDWYFCDSPDCDVVYYTPEGETRTRADLSVRVGVKEREAPRPLCYCFGHTAESIADEIERTRASTVVASVAAHVKAGGCSCETTNPSGRCCLGALRQEVAAATARAGLAEFSRTAVSADDEDCCAAPTCDEEAAR